MVEFNLALARLAPNAEHQAEQQDADDDKAAQEEVQHDQKESEAKGAASAEARKRGAAMLANGQKFTKFEPENKKRTVLVKYKPMQYEQGSLVAIDEKEGKEIAEIKIEHLSVEKGKQHATWEANAEAKLVK